MPHDNPTPIASPPIATRPEHSKVPLRKMIGELPAALKTGPGGIAGLLRAAGELARAHRLVFGQPISALQLKESDPTDGASQPALSAKQEKQITRVSRSLNIMAPRVPWRADCLVQAVAGRHWLARYDIPAQISLGTRRSTEEEFLAHAWLTVGEQVVTGGDISSFSEFAPFS